MAPLRSKVTAQGRTSIPAGIGPGSVVQWEEDGDKLFVSRAGFSNLIRRAERRKPISTAQALKGRDRGRR